MEKVYCIECGHCKYEGPGVYSCLAPENRIERIYKHTWLRPEKISYVENKQQSELNAHNDCPYFKKGETQV